MGKTRLFPWKCSDCGRTFESNQTPKGAASDGAGRALYFCEDCAPVRNFVPPDLAKLYDEEDEIDFADEWHDDERTVEDEPDDNDEWWRGNNG